MLSYTWTLADGETQIDLELEYEVELVKTEGIGGYSGYKPCVTIADVQPECHAKAFYAQIDSDPELWPHVEQECLGDWGASFDYSGD